jgi:predicted flap endonuclease-1-like 5' DNA nuclease
MVRTLVVGIIAAASLVGGGIIGFLLGLSKLQGGLLVVVGLAFGVALGVLIDWLIEEAIRRNRELILQVESARQLPAPVAASAAGMIVSGEGSELASQTLADFLRQRDDEIKELRVQLEKFDGDLEQAKDRYADYVRSHPDDLTVIKGIGPVFQWRLRDIGFNTYRDLATADTDQLRRLLGVKDWQQANIEAWITQARDWAERT